MLDAFEIVTTSGVVLWSRSNSPIGAAPVNSLINNVFIEEKVRPTSHAGGNPTYRYENYTLKWTIVKDLGLIFVVRALKFVESRRTDPDRLFINPFCTFLGSIN